MLNLNDILFMKRAGTLKPNASITDILFAQRLQSAAEKLVTILGNLLSFLAKKAQTAVSTKVTLEPIQDLHGYDNPWPAGGGVNKFDKNTAVNGERISAGGFAPADGTSRSGYIPCLPNTEYYFVNIHGSSVMSGVYWFDANKGYISANLIGANSPASGAVTSPANAAYMGINMPADSVNNAAVNYPSTVTTYSPYSNICPISGRSSVEIKGCGKNLFNKTTVTDGYFDADGNIVYVDNTSVSDYIMVMPNQTYYFGAWYSQMVARYCCYYDKNKNFLGTFRPNYSGESITIPSDVQYVRVSIRNEYIDAYQLELGSSATEYEPYTESNDVTITFPALGKNLFYYDESKVSVCETSTETVRSYYPTGITNCTITFSAYLIDSESVTNTFINVGKLVDGKLYVLGSFLSTNGSITNRTVTFADGEEAVLMSAVSETSGITLNLPKYNIQCEIGSSATTFEPYTKTVYGGTLDVETGVLTVDKASIDLGTFTWNKGSASSQNHFYMSADTTTFPYKYSNDNEMSCSCYAFDGFGNSGVGYYGENGKFRYFYAGTQSNAREIYVTDAEKYASMNAQQFKEAMSGQMLVYELATPRTIQLTPEQIQILKGQNTIWIEDVGAVMELTYKE